MTSKFLGKWRIHQSKSWRGFSMDAYASYTPSGGRTSSQPALCLWVVGQGNVFPPGKETNVAFFLREDRQLCLLLNNGKWVGDGNVFVQALAQATAFTFSGHDSSNLPTAFNAKILVPQFGHTLFDEVFDHTWFLVHNQLKEEFAPVFSMSQLTPPLESVQAKNNGDGLDFSWLDLTGVKLTNCSLKKAQFNNCSMQGTDFSGSNLAGANLNQVDLTGVVVANPLPHFHTTPLQPPSHDNPRTTLVGSRLKQSLLDNDWSMLDLTGATIMNLPSPLSSETKPLKANYSILTGLNENTLSDLSLDHAVFDNAVLDRVNLNGCVLSNASFIQASMHETVLSNATLKNAVMTGAQLGSLSQLFMLPAGYEAHLKAGPSVDPPLRDQFAQHGITLSPTATVTPRAADRVWELNDAGNGIIYNVRLEGDPSKVLMVYKPGVAASLVNAYMPNAVLTGANLYGVIATGVQFYGSKARLDGSAILEKVEFNDANLSNVNFTQANLYGANLSNSHLFNAKFNNANLSPSADGVATNLSKANLQGADFAEAKLYSANLTNAAVAINVPTKFNPKQGGVYLFSLPYSKQDPSTLQQYTAELTAAAKGFFNLPAKGDTTTVEQYQTALNAHNLGPLKIGFLKQQPPVTLSANAQIKIVEENSVWQIVDGAKSYSVWTGPDQSGNIKIFVAPSLTNTQAGFKNRNMNLRWQARASIDTADQQWSLDNDSENPKNTSTGYVGFLVKLNDKVLDVYGTALRIVRLGDNNQEQFTTETCQITNLSKTNMNADTVCPNGATLSANQAKSHTSWDTLWLRAATLPQPPDCVPTDFNWCLPPSKRKE